MPRPDLTAERTSQILDAFERCIACHGLDGSSLDKIAEEAGMKRTILRHYIGNRDDLILALTDRIVERWEASINLLEMAPLGKDPVKTLVSYLYDDYEGDDGTDMVVAGHLIAAGDRHPEVGKRMRNYVEDFTEVISKRLKMIHSRATPTRRWQVAYGITAILFNEALLITLNLAPDYHVAARRCTTVLIDSLG